MAAAVSYLTSAGDGATATTYTFSSQTLGVAAADRYIVVLVGSSSISTGGFASVSVGGVSATEVAEEATGNPADVAGMWIALVPTGTTGDVVVTCNASNARCGIGLWRLTGVDSITPHAFGQDNGTLGANPSASTTVAVESGGMLVAGAYTSNGTTVSLAWTGVTEDFETVAELNSKVSGGSDDSGTVEVGKTVTVDCTSTNTRVAMIAASWSPAAAGSLIKSVNGVLRANIKSWNGVILE